MPTNAATIPVADHSPEVIAERQARNSKLFIAADSDVRTSSLLVRALVFALRGVREENRDYGGLDDDDVSCVLELAELADREITKVAKIYGSTGVGGEAAVQAEEVA